MTNKIAALIVTIMAIVALVYIVTTLSVLSNFILGKPENARMHNINYTVVENKEQEALKRQEKKNEKHLVKLASKHVDGYKKQNKHNIKLLSKLVYAEANTEPFSGMVAVASVVLNRVDAKSFPDTIENVIYAPGQFQPVANGAINNNPSQQAIDASKQAIQNRNTNALYFYNPRIITDKWITTRKTLKVIGNHVFAK